MPSILDRIDSLRRTQHGCLLTLDLGDAVSIVTRKPPATEGDWSAISSALTVHILLQRHYQQKAQQQDRAPSRTVSPRAGQEAKKARKNRAESDAEPVAATTCDSAPNSAEYPLGESNTLRKTRGKRGFPIKAAQNAAHLAHQRP